MTISSADHTQQLLAQQQQIQKDFTDLSMVLQANPNHERIAEIKRKLEELKTSHAQISKQLQDLRNAPDSPVKINNALPSKSGFFGLLKHIIYVLLRKTGPRISRGEFWLGMIALSTIITLGVTVGITVHKIPWAILGIIGLVRSILLYIKRFHDLDKKGLNVLLILFGSFWTAGVVYAVIKYFLPQIMKMMMFGGGLDGLIAGGLVGLLGMIAISLFVVFMFTYCMYVFTICFYHKGTLGNNQYGADPLSVQMQFPNGAYRILWIILLLVPVLLGIFKTIIN